jgi:hypothetical protein
LCYVNKAYSAERIRQKRCGCCSVLTCDTRVFVLAYESRSYGMIQRMHSWSYTYSELRKGTPGERCELFNGVHLSKSSRIQPSDALGFSTSRPQPHGDGERETILDIEHAYLYNKDDDDDAQVGGEPLDNKGASLPPFHPGHTACRASRSTHQVMDARKAIQWLCPHLPDEKLAGRSHRRRHSMVDGSVMVLCSCFPFSPLFLTDPDRSWRAIPPATPNRWPA